MNNILLKILIFIFLVYPFIGQAKETGMFPQPMKSIFGLNSDLKQFPGKSESEIAELLKSYGINAVFGGYENPKLRDELKKRNIRIYAEIGIFAGVNYWETHPESRPVTDRGKWMEKEEWYGGLCPNQDWLWKEKLNKLDELCKKYRVDGIWLDFIRYPCHWEVQKPNLVNTCFCQTCLTKFQQKTDIQIPDHLTGTPDKADWILQNHKKEWVKWRCDVITGFVGESRDVIKKYDSKIVLGLFGIPWSPDDYQNAIIDIIAQDYKALADHVDVFSPMVYHKMCYRDTGWIAEITDYLTQRTNKPVIPIVQACSIPTPLKEPEFRDTLDQGLKYPSSGIIVFTLDYALKENKMGLIKDSFTGQK